MQKPYKYSLLYPLLVTSCLNANQGCNISSIIAETLPMTPPPTFKIREEKIKEETKKNVKLKITKTLTSITIVHENQIL